MLGRSGCSSVSAYRYMVAWQVLLREKPLGLSFVTEGRLMLFRLCARIFMHVSFVAGLFDTELLDGLTMPVFR